MSDRTNAGISAFPSGEPSGIPNLAWTRMALSSVLILFLASACSEPGSPATSGETLAPERASASEASSGLVSARDGSRVGLSVRILEGEEEVAAARRAFIEEMETLAPHGEMTTRVVVGKDNVAVEGHWSEIFTDDFRRVRPELLDRP
jgi:hypothetical protein